MQADFSTNQLREVLILRVGITVFVFGVLASVIEPPSYLGLIIGAAIVIAVLRLLYRLNTWSPPQTA